MKLEFDTLNSMHYLLQCFLFRRSLGNVMMLQTENSDASSSCSDAWSRHSDASSAHSDASSAYLDAWSAYSDA